MKREGVAHEDVEILDHIVQVIIEWAEMSTSDVVLVVVEGI